MQTRTRSKSSIVDGGKVRQSNGNLLGEFSYTEFTQTTTDAIKKSKREDGSTPPSDFSSDSRTVLPKRLTKTTGTFRFENLATAEGAYIPGLTPPLSVRGSAARIAENNFYTQQLLAATNPLRSDFSVPVFIKELVELPSLFKLVSKSLGGLVGGSYLNYRFGWAQFYRDVRELEKITRAIEYRLGELNSLVKKGGLRRKVDLVSNTHSVTETDVVIHSTYGVTVKATRTSSRKTKIWGSVRWKPLDGFLQGFDQLQRFNLAVREVLDLETLDYETAYQLIPFSWLSDYFTGISDYLIANNGRQSVEPYDICIMRRTQVVDKYQVTSIPSTTTASGVGSHTRTLLERDVWFRGDYPAVPIELLNFSQWKVVLALFISLGQKLR